MASVNERERTDIITRRSVARRVQRACRYRCFEIKDEEKVLHFWILNTNWISPFRLTFQKRRRHGGTETMQFNYFTFAPRNMSYISTVNLFTERTMSTKMQSLLFAVAVGSPEWTAFPLMDHQYPGLRAAVPSTYWIIDVFGYPSLSTITASIKVLMWLIAPYANSYPRKPLQNPREATAAMEIYMAAIRTHFLFKCWRRLLRGTHQSRRPRCRRGERVAQPPARKCASRAAFRQRDWCTPGGSWVGWLQSERGVWDGC